MVFDESMNDFYCFVDILEDNMFTDFYMIKNYSHQSILVPPSYSKARLFLISSSPIDIPST